MELFELARSLIDIESVTPNELEVGQFLHSHLKPLAEKYDGQVDLLKVESGRYNVLGRWGKSIVTFSTHMDSVPPFFPSREDEEFIWGRGACDTKGIMASMLKALEELLQEGVRNLAVLFVVGEEVNAIGARMANKSPFGSKYLINGEPTDNKLALGSKGAIRVKLEAHGKMAHSAYPELGDSAIDKLLDNLQSLRSVRWPVDPILGPSTSNIGVISGGRAANVIADHASATLFIRVVSDMEKLKRLITSAVDERVALTFESEVPAVRLKALPGFETTIVKYTTDVPNLTNWGEPLLIGPGSIHVAHTEEERISKRQMQKAVGLYQRLAKRLLDEHTKSVA